MLPQFQIRNLQDPSLSLPLASHPRPVAAVRNALISINAAEYEWIINTCPPAALQYMDVEDGETIRVGSSLELAQRLDDAIPALPAAEPWPTEAGLTGHHASSSLPSYHTFDVNSRRDVLQIWSNLERRTMDPALAPTRPSSNLMVIEENKARTNVSSEPTMHSLAGNTDALAKAFQRSRLDKPPNVPQDRQPIRPSPNVDIVRELTDGQSNTISKGPRDHLLGGPQNRRSQYFHATSPPVFRSEDQTLPLVAVDQSEELPRAEATANQSFSNLTWEGKKQVGLPPNNQRLCDHGHVIDRQARLERQAIG